MNESVRQFGSSVVRWFSDFAKPMPTRTPRRFWVVRRAVTAFALMTLAFLASWRLLSVLGVEGR